MRTWPAPRGPSRPQSPGPGPCRFEAHDEPGVATGQVELEVPRDRGSTFESAIVKKRQRRFASPPVRPRIATDPIHQIESLLAIPLDDTTPTEEGIAAQLEERFSVSDNEQQRTKPPGVHAVELALSEGIVELAAG